MKRFLSKTTQVLLLSTSLVAGAFDTLAQRTSDFENLPLKPNSFWNGDDKSGGFKSGEINFKNSYNEKYFSWSGFAYSNMTDTKTEGYGNQYSTFAGNGANDSKNFGISFGSSIVRFTTLTKGCKPKGVYVSNTTLAALDMKNGSKFSKKFGGASGNDKDFFLLQILNYNNGKGTDTSKVYLADYRFEDNTKDYILNTWQYVDLSKFNYSDSIQFSLSSSDMGEWGMNTPAYFCFDNFTIVPAPFAPPAGLKGSTAIAKDSSVFKAWATNIDVIRGWRDISIKDSGRASYGLTTNAIGKAGENGLVSLGDGGVATLTFAKPITNGAGADFAVFENGFLDTYLELAFVEVSSDGKRFVRFPATSYTDTTLQVGPFGSLDTKMINNLAGKYRAGFGTPFDLQELKDSAGININTITHVRIIDVVGSIDKKYATRDSEGNIINDLWPTTFSSSGFDLDAVGVINESGLIVVEAALPSNSINVYPNPVAQGSRLFLSGSFEEITYKLYHTSGGLVKNGKGNNVEIENIDKGLYLLVVNTDLGQWNKKIVIE